MKWLRLSGSALLAALAAAGALLLAWARRDARAEARDTIEKKDLHHADAIADRVSDSRADPERLRPFDDRGWRD